MEGEPSAHRAQPREAGQELPGRWAVPRAGLGRPRLRTAVPQRQKPQEGCASAVGRISP